MEKTIYCCDKCGKELGTQRICGNYIFDPWNYCYYDLCSDCKELWDKYNSAVKKLDDEIKQFIEEGGWGRHILDKEKRDEDEQRNNN